MCGVVLLSFPRLGPYSFCLVLILKFWIFEGAAIRDLFAFPALNDFLVTLRSSFLSLTYQVSQGDGQLSSRAPNRP